MDANLELDGLNLVDGKANLLSRKKQQSFFDESPNEPRKKHHLESQTHESTRKYIRCPKMRDEKWRYKNKFIYLKIQRLIRPLLCWKWGSTQILHDE